MENTTTRNEEFTLIPATSIYPHPDNPRKDLGDLTELTESIRKKGVLQNLTVIPGHWDENRIWHDDGYTLIIGHRRFTAGKNAGVTEFRCRITEMDQKEQISIMLEENMQRNDLTIWEQSQGFQMMLDLGETEATISEKTGFSKSTVRHRLNLAKLNQRELEKKEKDEGFQLTLASLYELEKVPDVKTRNQILKSATDARELVTRAQNAVAEAKRKDCEKSIAKMLKAKGIEKAADDVKNELYSSKWTIVKEYSLDKNPPEKLSLPKSKEPMYWLVYCGYLKVICKNTQKRELSKHEKEEKERKTANRKIKAILRESTARRKELIQNIISGKISPVKNEAETKDAIWQALVSLGSGVYSSTLRDFFLEKESWQCSEAERNAADEKVAQLSVLHQMLLILHFSMKATNELRSYQGELIQSRGEALLKGYAVLEQFGWYFESDEEKQVLDGSHELYVKKQAETKE